jgi:hypothetical protein
MPPIRRAGSAAVHRPTERRSTAHGPKAETAAPKPQQGWKPKSAGAVVKIKDSSIGQSQISRALADAMQKREVMLKDPSKAQRLATVLPEDLSLKVKAFHMANTGGDITGGGLIPLMAKIGKQEGFEVVVRTAPYFKDRLEKEYAGLKLDNIKVVSMDTPNPEGGDFWTEDQGDLDARGGVAVPAMLRKGMELPTFTGQPEAIASRNNRGWKDAMSVPVCGAVGMRDAQESLVALAVAAGRPLRVNLSHIEGGNQLTGTLPNGERYALVGKDSIAVTGALLKRDLGRKVSLEEAKKAIAADLGISPKNVFDIEQPGDFHLDMAMSVMKPGQVMLNDSKGALELQSKWLTEDHAKKKPERKPGESAEKFKARMSEWNDAGKDLKQNLADLEKETRVRAGLEKLAEADLKAAGLQVVRAPGVFLDPTYPDRQIMNFLNGEGGQNSAGKSFFITQGGDKRAQDAFKTVLDAKVGIDRVHFLDKELSKLTLHDMGGISCRARAEGEV